MSSDIIHLYIGLLYRYTQEASCLLGLLSLLLRNKNLITLRLAKETGFAPFSSMTTSAKRSASSSPAKDAKKGKSNGGK